jgi:hypothetical protein
MSKKDFGVSISWQIVKGCSSESPPKRSYWVSAIAEMKFAALKISILCLIFSSLSTPCYINSISAAFSITFPTYCIITMPMNNPAEQTISSKMENKNLAPVKHIKSSTLYWVTIEYAHRNILTPSAKQAVLLMCFWYYKISLFNYEAITVTTIIYYVIFSIREK